jgi:hypothetical protein
MTRFILIMFIILLCPEINGQYFSYGINTGYGTYRMEELKDFQNFLKSVNVGLDAEVTESFPGWVFFSGVAEYRTRKEFSFGMKAALFSTGGRNHVGDYSGEYRLDMLIKSYNLGLFGKIEFLRAGDLRIYATINPGIKASRLRIHEFINIYHVDSTGSKASFKSLSFFVMPEIGVRYYLTRQLSLGIDAGYEVNLKAPLYFNNSVVFMQNNRKVMADWSGFRVSAGIYFDLKFNRSLSSNPNDFSNIYEY